MFSPLCFRYLCTVRHVCVRNYIKLSYNFTSTVACEPWLGFKEEIGHRAPICSACIRYEILVALPYNPKEIVVNIDATEIHKKVSSE